MIAKVRTHSPVVGLQTSASLADCVRTGKNAFQLLHGMESIFAYLENEASPLAQSNALADLTMGRCLQELFCR
jgi:hypothetical protein